MIGSTTALSCIAFRAKLSRSRATAVLSLWESITAMSNATSPERSYVVLGKEEKNVAGKRKMRKKDASAECLSEIG